MPISDRDYFRGRHPPTCTCKECTERRLSRFRNQGNRPGRSSSTHPVNNIIDKLFRDTNSTSDSHTVTAQQSRSKIKASNKSVVINPVKLFRKIWRRTPASIIKLFLSLIVIAGLVDIIRRGYLLFTQQTDPIKNTFIFLIEVGLWFWLVNVLRSRRYKYRKPKFRLVLATVIAITLVCSFAGIEPLSSYKDNLFNSISSYLEEQQAIREVEEKAAEEASIQAEALTKAGAEREVEETAKTAKAEALAKVEAEREIEQVERDVLLLVNMIRADRGSDILIWDSRLYQYSKAHSEKMAKKGEMFHSDMNLPYGENAWYGSGNNWEAWDIVESWLGSPPHRTWLLSPHLKHIAIGIALSQNRDMYASWTFWRDETSDEDWWYTTDTSPPDWWELDWKASR